MADDAMVVLRNIANQANTPIGYNADTKGVSLAGQSYTPQQLSNLGGKLVNGYWNVPQSVATQLVKGNSSGQQSQAIYPSTRTASQNQQMSELTSMLQSLSDSYYSQQKSQLQATLDSQITELEKAYSDAVSEGRISVRDAQSAFEEQKSAIEKEAYEDSDRTALYANDMGIQNSQQMLGLMAGDNARANTLLNKNATDRDKRIADIKDRLNAVKLQRDLDVNSAKATYESGLLNAQGEANQMYANNLYNLKSNDYQASRDQQYALDSANYADQLQRGQMALQHGYDVQNMETQYGYQTKLAQQASDLAIDQMNIQHGFDMETLQANFQNELTAMAKQYGYSSSLQSQSSANAMAQMSQKYALEVQAEEQAYQKQLARDLAGVTPGTSEYNVITQTAENQLKQKIKDVKAQAVAEYTATNILSAPDIPTISQPKDRGILNGLYGYNDKLNAYNAEQEAIARKKAYLSE